MLPDSHDRVTRDYVLRQRYRNAGHRRRARCLWSLPGHPGDSHLRSQGQFVSDLLPLGIVNLDSHGLSRNPRDIEPETRIDIVS